MKLFFAATLALLLQASTGHAEDHPIVQMVSEAGIKPGQPFALVVSVTAKPDLENQLVEAFREPIIQTRKEPGNMLYQLSQSPTSPAQFVLYEEWKSLDALDEHLAQPYLIKLLEDVSRLANAPDLKVMKLVTF